MAPIILYVTASTVEEAAHIGRALVEERLCACASVIPGVRSFYWWEGEVQDDPEAVLIAKTTEDRVTAATERVRKLHSYAVPCVAAVPITGGNAPFLDWVAAETRRVR